MKTVCISGATAGFGEALLHTYVNAGYHVIATGRRRERLTSFLDQYGPERITVLPFDIQNKQATYDAIATVSRPIDILINNAGLALGGLEDFDTVSDDAMETMVRTNVLGLLYLTKCVLPSMKQRNSGHIVNIGSVSGTYPYKGSGVYGASKAFVQMFSLNLRAELLGTAIRVSNIEPGVADTEFSLVRFDSQKRAKEVCENFSALTAEDIATVVFFVTSLPSHVNINTLELMSVDQSFAGFSIHRTTCSTK